jgi:hypothetical protein
MTPTGCGVEKTDCACAPAVVSRKTARAVIQHREYRGTRRLAAPFTGLAETGLAEFELLM